MKKKVLSVLLIAMLLSSCSTSKLSIKLNFAKENYIPLFNVKIDHDYGNYGDGRVIYITSFGAGYTSVNIYRYVGDRIFYSSDGYEVEVYYDHEFNNLTEAYNNQILSLEDVHRLYDDYVEYKGFTTDFLTYLDFNMMNLKEDDVAKNGLIGLPYYSYAYYGEYDGLGVYMFYERITIN